MSLPSLNRGAWGWLGLAALLALAALDGYGRPQAALDWQPALAATEPWRALTAIGVHYSARHLAGNVAGAVLVAALGVTARVPLAMAFAWAAAWPLTQFGLLARPDLLHYGGLSGVLHAGAAVVAIDLVCTGSTRQRLIGAALGAGLLVKVIGEAPWGPPLRHPAGWDIATAPLAHATGLIAGTVCALVAVGWTRRRSTSRAKTASER